ncbi:MULTISPECIES: PTS sugar transporter subunit IIB [Bacillaceae]|uniref:PTS sugar transporter subunit IIB n=1 Tax=Bacillaceae TaxID=186817 RepID=UPI00101CC07B|nr:PTS sugar transporter subunit IIB [Ectobacillus funiculus]
MKILLCCAAGMSTSIIVRKMQASAESQGKEYMIKAVDQGRAEEEIKDCDVVLLGPQIRFSLPRFQELGKYHNVPVEVINQMHYGMCNGEAILQHAESLVSKA